jgi:hypothetical protein
MHWNKDCYESGKMSAKTGIDYLQALRRRNCIYQTIFQNDNGPITEEDAKAYSIWEIFFYDFSDTDKQVVVCVS